MTGDIKPSLVAAVAVLIITCPCALGLAVPVTHVVAANRLFKEGVLMRDGSALERLAEADTVFFDKTGTLTSDYPTLMGAPDLGKRTAAVLCSLAKNSRHPAAQALAQEYENAGSENLSEITEVAGFGIEAVWQGKRVRLGRTEWVKQICRADEALGDGATAFAIEGDICARFHFQGNLRPDAAETVNQIQNDGYDTVIVSGDHQSAVADIARRVGIANWSHGLTPKQKVANIERESRTRKILMVGDGLNDAPSLAAAHVSMAPASATDVSRASADFIFTRSSLFAVPFAMQLSIATNRIVRQNFAIAIIYNCIAVPLAICGYVTPLVAAIAMSLSSIVVVSNSLRLSAFRAKLSNDNPPAVPSTESEYQLALNEGGRL